MVSRGYSANGRLGIVGAGAQYFRTPQAVDAASTYKQIATSWDASALIKADGTFYAMVLTTMVLLAVQQVIPMILHHNR